jgi:hypothetical protein
MAPPEIISYTWETVMESLQILGYALAFAVGFGFGMMGYRYALKRDPERLEKFAKEAKAFGDKAKEKF